MTRKMEQILTMIILAIFFNIAFQEELLSTDHKSVQESSRLKQMWDTRKNAGTEKVLDYQIDYLKFNILSGLFDLIFVDEEYFFQADNESPVILDCGSNIGMSILYFKKLYPKAKIIGFEPAPETFKTLKRNIEQNHLEDVVVWNKALHKTKGHLTLYSNFHGSEGATLVKGWTKTWGIRGQEYKIETCLLSDFINEEIDFIKLDIEGVEGIVLEELASSGKLRMIKQLLFEYHRWEKDNGEFSKLLKILDDNGFEYQVDPGQNRSLSTLLKQEKAWIVRAYRKAQR